MTIKCCFSGVDSAAIPLLTSVLSEAGVPASISIAKMNVTDVAKIAPALVVCDIDALTVDKHEQLRQLRFVSPDATIVVYTGQLEEAWAAACHLAGANGVLSKQSSQTELSSGIRNVLRSGCYTDPRFIAQQYVR